MTEAVHLHPLDAAGARRDGAVAHSGADLAAGGGTASVAPVNAMTVDVEDYFQVSALAPHVRRDTWDDIPSRVERNTDRVLETFAEYGVRATFFTLAWVAARFPQIVARIVDGGHELASHGMAHVRVSDQTPEQFAVDVACAKAVLEDVGGVPVRGYRAASFSIGADTPWAFDVLAGAGYSYSSSIYPIRHDHYGMPDAPRFAHRPIADRDFVEVPITTTLLGGRTVPCGGGGYFRLLPYAWSRWALRRVHGRDGQPVVFYFHPWEVDPEQPRVPGVGPRARFRHYTNLHRMRGKVRAVLRDFRWDRLDRVIDRLPRSEPAVVSARVEPDGAAS